MRGDRAGKQVGGGYTRRLIRAAEMWQMYDLGLFAGQRVELIGGELLVVPPRSNRHAAGVHFLNEVLRKGFGPEYWVRCQGSLDLDEYSVPDPDAAAVPGRFEELSKLPENPKSAVLVAEVSELSLPFDRTVKASMYAAAGILDYWIVNIPDRQLEIYRFPQPDPTQEFGYVYGSLLILKPGDELSPLAAPAAVIPVDRLFG